MSRTRLVSGAKAPSPVAGRGDPAGRRTRPGPGAAGPAALLNALVPPVPAGPLLTVVPATRFDVDTLTLMPTGRAEVGWRMESRSR